MVQARFQGRVLKSLDNRAVILFRNVEHCGISSTQFRDGIPGIMCGNYVNARSLRDTKFIRGFVIPESEGIPGNYEEFSLESMPGISGIDGTRSLSIRPHKLSNDGVPRIGWN